MDTALGYGDFLKNNCGLPKILYGDEEVLQQARIRLQIPLGSFCYLPSLGSRLYLIAEQKENVNKNSLALALAQEALRPMQILAQDAVCEEKDGCMKITVLIPQGKAEMFFNEEGEYSGNL